MVTVRPEQDSDHAAVERVHLRAFGGPEEGGIVRALRGDRCISLVAEEEGRVTGHVFFTPVTVEGDGEPLRAMALGPMAVDPDRQQRGVGSALVEAGLEECRASGIPVVFVLGHPSYYPRFGFTPAGARGIRCEFPVPDEVFLLVELVPGGLAGRTGVVRYAPEFSNRD